jgi:hypothetical protein
MSKEWLAQLSATAAAKRGGLAPRPPAPSRPQPLAAAVARGPDVQRRSFIGTIIGSIIRWGIIGAIAGAIFVFVVASNEYLEDSLGDNVLYAIWYLASAVPAAISADAVAAVDANAIYDALKPHAGLLPFLAPLAFGVAVTLLFLPTVNAYRRRSGLRFFILLFNLAILYWAWRSSWIAIDLTGRKGWINSETIKLKALIPWAILLLFSFIGVRRSRSSSLQPTPAPAYPAMAPRNAAPPRVPSHAASAATRSVSPTQMMPQRRGGSPIDRSVSGSSWRRPR